MVDCIAIVMEHRTMTYSVLICDDEQSQAENWIEDVQNIARSDTYNIMEPPSNEDVSRAMKEIFLRRSSVRDGLMRQREECLFDEVDILVIDYDLVHIDENQAQHTGESIARLARTFSDCSVTVVLNQFQGMDFDLSLRGHLASHADLNINGNLLAIPGLWEPPPWNDFRPWHWQTLSEAVETQKAREAHIKNFLDQPIIDFFEMQEEDALRLSDTAFGFIAPEAKNFEELKMQNFRSFVLSAQGNRDAQALLNYDESAAVRFIAARIGKWLERELLGPQDVLLDVPHMLQRFPFLIEYTEDDVREIDAWNKMIHDTRKLQETPVSNYWFGPENFLSRPAVWSQKLEEDEEFREKRAKFDYTNVPDIVFLEDLSAFARISDAKEFRAGFHNSYDRRFVKDDPSFVYGPKRRFAFGR